MCIMYHSNRSWSIFNQIHPSWSPICSCVYYELLPLHYSGKYPSWYRNNRCDDKLSIFVKISKKGQTRGWILAHFYLSCSKYSLHSLFGRIGGLHLTYYLRWMNHQSHCQSGGRSSFSCSGRVIYTTPRLHCARSVCML